MCEGSARMAFSSVKRLPCFWPLMLVPVFSHAHKALLHEKDLINRIKAYKDFKIELSMGYDRIGPCSIAFGYHIF